MVQNEKLFIPRAALENYFRSVVSMFHVPEDTVCLLLRSDIYGDGYYVCDKILLNKIIRAHLVNHKES